MITISISPQTPEHMSILGQALIAMLSGDYEPKEVPVTIEAAPAKKPRKAATEAAPAPTPVAVVTATATPTPEAVPSEPVAASPSKAVTLEEVRAKLAALSQAGKTAEVKTLISQFGAGKLTDLAADKYAEVLTAAEAL